MTKRIKHISELPAWFQLQKYNGLKELDATGWYEQLIIRKNFLTLIKNTKQQDEPLEEDAYDSLLQLIRANPIVNTTEDDLLSAILGDNVLTELKPKKPNYALGVHPLTLNELFNLQSRVSPEKWQHLRKWRSLRKNFANLKLNSKKIARYSYRPWIDEPIDKHSFINKKTFEAVTVNLDLPDNILMEHFKQFLATQRAKNKYPKITKHYRQPDFNDWVRFGVLPYLDLQIWEKEASVSIPNRVLADAIFPTGEGGEETVRKTTTPLAELLISNEQLSTLGAQAALQIAEQHNR